jgi:hypothetical protein
MIMTFVLLYYVSFPDLGESSWSRTRSLFFTWFG